MHFLMPKDVLEKYFRPPYFRSFECALFSGLPYAPMRTIMFMRVIAYPSSGARRGLTEVHLLVPQWYRVASKAVVIFIFTLAGAVVLQIVSLWILLSLEKTPV